MKYTDLHYRQQEVIAQGALTNSKRPECLVKGVFPTHVTKGQGVHLWDTEGKRYVDYICGLGTNFLGYGFHEIATAVSYQVGYGASFSLSTLFEVETAEKLKEFFPFTQQWKFLKSGSEACSAAIRIARAYTQKDQILSEGYHGWHDDFVSLTPPAEGVPGSRAIEKFTDFDQITKETAAVIVEPVSLDDGIARRKWLEALRQKCTDTGTLLIFDEIITGFRFQNWGVCNAWNVTPDLICLGKAIAGGLPLAAVGGRRSIMSGTQYFVSSTYAGETLSLVAALQVMKALRTKYDVNQLWEKGERFRAEFNQMDPKGELKIQGYATRGAFTGDLLTKALFWQEACKAGILFGPSWFYAFPHIEVADQVLSACKDIITRIRTGNVRLEGEIPQTPFAQRVREEKKIS